uniref:NPC intracellular cholesterol transporter 2-like protein n=1 Tax=Pardosa astrigera TaxID=317848 RepID=A0AA96Y7I4_PARAW|nr:NPC intracellular cholesterol transporter 2-like protein [Pardosa astrigera]
MWFVLLILSYSFARHVSSEQVSFIPCGENTFSSLYITPCNATTVNVNQTCVLMHGHNILFQAYFVSPFNSSSLQVATMITLEGVEVPSINSGYDPCFGSITPACPVTEGKTYFFQKLYNVQSEFPIGLMDLKLVILDMETKDVAGCGKIKILVAKNPDYMYLD